RRCDRRVCLLIRAESTLDKRRDRRTRPRPYTWSSADCGRSVVGRWISIDGVETAGKSTLVAHMSRLRPQWAVSSRFSQTRLGDILADGFRTNPYVAQRPAA